MMAGDGVQGLQTWRLGEQLVPPRDTENQPSRIGKLRASASAGGGSRCGIRNTDTIYKQVYLSHAHRQLPETFRHDTGHCTIQIDRLRPDIHDPTLLEPRHELPSPR